MVGNIWGACYLLSRNIILFDSLHMTITASPDSGPDHIPRKIA